MGDKHKQDGHETEKEKKLASQTDKQLSTSAALLRIIVGIVAFLWFLAGGSAQTVLALSGSQLSLAGVISFLVRNPITFLIIGLLNVISGIILLIFFVSFLALSIFHFIWSIRWFYGYWKYRNLEGSE